MLALRAHAPSASPMRGVWSRDAEGRPDSYEFEGERWGNRRRRERRRGAATALEWRLVRTPRRDAVSSEVTAGAARSPSRAPAEVPRALRAAVRADRDSWRAQVHWQAIEPMIGPADGGDGSRAKHAAGEAGRSEGAKRARMTAAPQRCRPEANGPRRRPDAGMTTRPAMRCGQTRQTGMPSDRALSTRFSVMPEPGKAITPFGRRLRSSSLRRNGAARPWRSQSGLQTTW